MIKVQNHTTRYSKHIDLNISKFSQISLNQSHDQPLDTPIIYSKQNYRKYNKTQRSQMDDSIQMNMFDSILTGRSSVSNFNICDINKTHRQLGNLEQKFLNNHNNKCKKVRKTILTRQNTIKRCQNQGKGILNPSAKQLQEYRNINKQFYTAYLQLARAYRNQLEQANSISQEQSILNLQINHITQNKISLKASIQTLNNTLIQFQKDIQKQEQLWFTKVKSQCLQQTL